MKNHVACYAIVWGMAFGIGCGETVPTGGDDPSEVSLEEVSAILQDGCWVVRSMSTAGVKTLLPNLCLSFAQDGRCFYCPESALPEMLSWQMMECIWTQSVSAISIGREMFSEARVKDGAVELSGSDMRIVLEKDPASTVVFQQMVSVYTKPSIWNGQVFREEPVEVLYEGVWYTFEEFSEIGFGIGGDLAEPQMLFLENAPGQGIVLWYSDYSEATVGDRYFVPHVERQKWSWEPEVSMSYDLYDGFTLHFFFSEGDYLRTAAGLVFKLNIVPEAEWDDTLSRIREYLEEQYPDYALLRARGLE